ncbi:MAG: glycosyltransferase, partial [Pseudomonadota bacterium]
MSPVQPFVSVIIPVFNDSKRLVTCLTALSNQSYGQENYEVIVADNGSTDDISSAAKEFSVTLVSEKKPGSYAARNKGLSVAKGEILAFTDADCIPREDWVETGVKKVLESQNCGLIAGRIDVILKDPENPSIIEFFDSATAFPQKHFIEADKFGATANIFTTKKVIKNVGGFNSELKSNGDREWGNRVHKAGYALIYDHSLCVRHPARHKFSQIRKKYARLIGGQHDLNTKQGNYSIYK